MDSPTRGHTGAIAVCLFVLCLLAIGAPAVAQPSTPIDDAPDDTDTDTDDRVLPSEQVPFGVRAIYGDETLTKPTGGAGVTVAVVDSGVDTSHPDLQDRVTQCLDFTGEAVRNGCTDRNGHGTHVAGTVAADGGPDDRGIYGVAPEAEIYAYKTCDDEGRCGADALSEAVRTAADEGADIVVLSLGGRDEPRIRDAVQYAAERDVLLVAAAGNSGPDLGSILYPSAHPNAIAVGAAGTRRTDRIAADNYGVPSFSSRGVEEPFEERADARLELVAPGVSVLSPVPGGDYGTKTGSSMAAPHVAGLAAKILGAADEPLSAAALRAELRDRAPRYDVTAGRYARAGYDPAAGFGVPTVSEPTAAFDVDPDVPVSDEAFALEGSPSRSDAPITDYAWDTTNDGSVDRRGKRIDLQKPPGTHPITLRVTDAENATATVTEEVFVNDRPRVTVSAPDAAAPGENVPFEAAIEDEFGDTEVLWTFPDGATASGERVVRSFEGGDRSVTVTVTVSDEFGAIRTDTATVSIRPTTVEEQGPGLAPALVIALAVCALAARRYR